MLSNQLTIIAEAPHWEAAHLEEKKRERKNDKKVTEVRNLQILLRILTHEST